MHEIDLASSDGVEGMKVDKSPRTISISPLVMESSCWHQAYKNDVYFLPKWRICTFLHSVRHSIVFTQEHADFPGVGLRHQPSNVNVLNSKPFAVVFYTKYGACLLWMETLVGRRYRLVRVDLVLPQ